MSKIGEAYLQAHVLLAQYLQSARTLAEQGDYDGAALALYNFCITYLQYKLKELNVQYPPTRVVRMLLRRLGRVLNREQEFEKFIEENITAIVLIEDVPVRLQVLKRGFSREEVEKMFSFVDKLVQLLS